MPRCSENTDTIMPNIHQNYPYWKTPSSAVLFLYNATSALFRESHPFTGKPRRPIPCRLLLNIALLSNRKESQANRSSSIVHDPAIQFAHSRNANESHKNASPQKWVANSILPAERLLYQSLAKDPPVQELTSRSTPSNPPCIPQHLSLTRYNLLSFFFAHWEHLFYSFNSFRGGTVWFVRKTTFRPFSYDYLSGGTISNLI